MGGFSTYLENAIINHLLRNQPFTPPEFIYVGLFISPPSDSGGGTEVSGGAYARQRVVLTEAIDGTSTNIGRINFPIATSNWGEVKGFGLFDALHEGNLLLSGSLAENKVVYEDYIFSFLIGDLGVNVD